MTTNTVPTSSPLTAAALTAQINVVSLALANMVQGATAPTAASMGYTSIAGIWWHDTANRQIKTRNQADTAWIVIGTLDQTLGLFSTGQAPDRQIFTGAGTWTKPASGLETWVLTVGGGGGGAMLGLGSTQCGGGGMGVINLYTFRTSDLPATAAITIGAAGVGRTGTNGAGAAGGQTSFATHLTAAGGGGGNATGPGSGAASGTTAISDPIVAALSSANPFIMPRRISLPFDQSNGFALQGNAAPVNFAGPLASWGSGRGGDKPATSGTGNAGATGSGIWSVGGTSSAFGSGSGLVGTGYGAGGGGGFTAGGNGTAGFCAVLTT